MFTIDRLLCLCYWGGPFNDGMLAKTISLAALGLPRCCIGPEVRRVCWLGRKQWAMLLNQNKVVKVCVPRPLSYWVVVHVALVCHLLL